MFCCIVGFMFLFSFIFVVRFKDEVIWSTGLLQNLCFNFARKSYLHLREYLFKKKIIFIIWNLFNKVISVLHPSQRCSS